MRALTFISAVVFSALLVSGNSVLAQGNSQGHGHGKGHEKHADADNQGNHEGYGYEQNEHAIRTWYAENQGNLPPGLAKKDRLPPGLEKQLVRKGTLPPGLQKRIYPCPIELERQLPPPPPETRHVLVGGNIVLLNRKTNVVVDIFSF